LGIVQFVSTWSHRPRDRHHAANGHTMTTVLIAEDDEGVRLLLRTALERKGYDVLVAADGRAALDLLDRDDLVIDAVVSDVKMPGADGLDVLARARARRPGVALVLASGTDRWELPPDQVFVDVTVLEKPYGLDRLIEAIETALRAGGGP
jgi:DNA-binding NtrC family response regulator